MRCPHTTFASGKKILVVMRDGSRFVDKFVERTGKGMLFEQRGLIQVKDVRVCTIYRSRDTTPEPPRQRRK